MADEALYDAKQARAAAKPTRQYTTQSTKAKRNTYERPTRPAATQTPSISRTVSFTSRPVMYRTTSSTTTTTTYRPTTKAATYRPSLQNKSTSSNTYSSTTTSHYSSTTPGNTTSTRTYVPKTSTVTETPKTNTTTETLKTNTGTETTSSTSEVSSTTAAPSASRTSSKQTALDKFNTLLLSKSNAIESTTNPKSSSTPLKSASLGSIETTPSTECPSVENENSQQPVSSTSHRETSQQLNTKRGDIDPPMYKGQLRQKPLGAVPPLKPIDILDIPPEVVTVAMKKLSMQDLKHINELMTEAEKQRNKVDQHHTETEANVHTEPDTPLLGTVHNPSTLMQLDPIDVHNIPEDVIERAMARLTPTDLQHIREIMGIGDDSSDESEEEACDGPVNH